MSERKCKKCGCDIFIRDGDWLRCANCGATFFDLDSHEEMKLTMQVEQLEQKKKHVKKKRNSFKDVVDFCVPIVIAVVIAMLLKMFVFANAVVPTGSMLNTIQLNDRVTLRTEAQYLHTKQAEGDWGQILAELSVLPYLMFTVSDMYNFGTTDQHYYLGMVTFNYHGHRLAASYGRTRAGYNCSGGVCRYVPASKGFQISYNLTF